MGDYIPTTDEVRDGYYSPRESYEPDHNAEFDRWLAQHDSEITAKAEKRIIKLLESLFDTAENAETRRLLTMAFALIQGESVQEPAVSTNDGQGDFMDKGEDK